MMRSIGFLPKVAVSLFSGALLSILAQTANASTVSYAFDGSSVTPAFTASVSLDVTGGQATSGIGSIDFGGSIFDLTLITLSTPGGNYGGTTGFRDNHGTDIYGGNTAVPIDPNGLIFAISNNPQWGQDALFAVWDNGGGSFEYLLSATLADVFNVYYVLGTGTGTVLDSGNAVGATPLPGALPLFASGLGALGLLGWRRKRKNAAPLAAA
jgi:hypothetical protein